MLNTLLLAVLAPLSFEGGSPDAFAEAYFRATNEPVAVVATESSLPAIEIEAETQMGRNTAIDRATTLRRAEDALNSFGFDLWPQACIRNLAVSGGNPDRFAGTEFFPNRPPLPAENVRIEDGKVTIEPVVDHYVTLAGLARLDWSRPLTAHWIVARIPVAVRAVEMPEERFLRMVASAVGARLTVGARRIEALPDIAVYRRTRIAVLEAQERRAALDPMHRRHAARLRAHIDVLRLVSAESLRRSIAHANSIEEFDVAAISALGQVGLTYLSRLREIERTLRPGEWFPPGLFGLIEEPPVVKIRLDGNGEVSVMFRIPGGGAVTP